MDTLSVWRGTAAPTGYGMLGAEVRADVLVIGGGITGVTLALLLAEQGRDVLLLEADEIGSGSTGNSTGNLYETVSEGMAAIARRFSDDVARRVMAERRAAVSFIEERCGAVPEAAFRRCPLVQYAQSADQQQTIDQEFEALKKLGARAEQVDQAPATLPPATGKVLVLHDQAQFQPAAYVVGIARAAVAAGAKLHEHSRVLELDTKGRRAITASGAVVFDEVVHATHSPKGIHLVHTEMPVHREYAIALELGADENGPGPGTFWWQGSEGLSMRTLEADGRRYLVCAGQEQKVGVHNATAELLAVEQRAGKHFGDRAITHRWSAQNYKGADGLPYIGRNADGHFVATGFSTDGLTWGTAAARLISQELAGGKPAFAELVRPNRLNPVKGAKNIIEENVTVVKQLLKDYLTGRQNEKLESLAAGDSAIVDAEGETFAAYRAADGELFAVSNICPHMGCKVHWNSVETSWDCPCHGSRFRPDGTVIEGPALSPLRRKHLPALGSEPG